MNFFTKKHLSITTFFLLIMFPLFGQQNLEHSYPANYISQLQDIYIDGTGLGYTGGTCGVFRKTVDNGLNWIPATPPMDEDIEVIECAPSGCEKLLLISDSGMYRLENESWSEVTYPDFYPDGEIHWITEDIVIHETGGDSFFRSTDGGMTWTEIALEGNQGGDMKIFDGGLGYVFVDNRLYQSLDQMQTLDTVGTYIHPESIYHSFWLNQNVGWIYDSNREIFRTTDGGHSWMLMNESMPLVNLNWVVPLSATHLVGARIVAHKIESFDGGSTWEITNFLDGGNRRVNERFHRNGDEFFLVGNQNQLLYSSDNFENFSLLDSVESVSTINAIEFKSADIGFALDERILKYTHDGGLTWSNHNLIHYGTDLILLDDGSLVVLTNGGSPKITSDDGMTLSDWHPEVFSGGFPFHAAKLPNGSIYLLGSEFGYLTTDGGLTFSSFDIGHEFLPVELYFLDNLNGYAIGSNKKFMYTEDGGATWTMGEGPTNNQTGLFFTDVQNGWISTASASYYTTDRGETWIANNSVGGYDVRRLSNGDLLQVKYASGNNGELLYSTDNGASWEVIAYNCFSFRSGGLTPDEKYVYVGGAGFIVRYELENLISDYRLPLNLSVTSLEVYPNPFSNELTVSLNEQTDGAILSLYNSNGSLLKVLNVSSGLESFSFSGKNLAKGIYFLKLETIDGVSTAYIVKQ